MQCDGIWCKCDCFGGRCERIGLGREVELNDLLFDFKFVLLKLNRLVVIFFVYFFLFVVFVMVYFGFLLQF